MDNTSSIAKFRTGCQRDIDMLNEGYLWFSNTRDLNDPFEGNAKLTNSTNIERTAKTLPLFKKLLQKQLGTTEYEINLLKYLEENASLLEKITPKEKDIYLEVASSTYNILATSHLEQVKDKSFIYSASDADDETIIKNPLLWGTYGEAFSGMCIIYDLNRILLQNREILASKVNYDRAPISAEDIIELLSGASSSLIHKHPILTKSHHWKHEKEIRLLSKREGRHHFDNSIVKAVYIADRMPKIKKDEITSICKEKYPNCKLKLAYFDQKQDDIIFKKISF